MRILITGGAGFIGSNLTAKCVENRHAVDIVDNLSNGHIAFVHPSVIENDRLYIADFSSDVILQKINNKSYDVVVHLAAQPRVGYSVEQPYETHQTNVTSTMKLLDACRNNIKRFVFASTSAVYGNVKELPTNENSEKNYQSPYALQKLIIEDYLRLYNKLYDFDSISLRFFNVFGPNQLGNSPYATAVSSWINSIMKNESMRSDGDGTQSRDMCYVDNVVDACVRSILVEGKFAGETMNVACGERVTNKEILQYLIKKFPNAKSHDAPWRPGDVMHTQADITKISELLGYKPLVHFWEGLDITLDWYKQNWKKIKSLSNE
jgi:UDP-N-acetylglucosamine 4-epimerase